jgi:hypothetical protein
LETDIDWIVNLYLLRRTREKIAGKMDWYWLITPNLVKKPEKIIVGNWKREKIAGKVDWYWFITSQSVKNTWKK